MDKLTMIDEYICIKLVNTGNIENVSIYRQNAGYVINDWLKVYMTFKNEMMNIPTALIKH